MSFNKIGKTEKLKIGIIMKKIFLLLILLSCGLSAQTFTVHKVNGKVMTLKGTSENWIEVKNGDKLNGNDLLVTSHNSYVQLSSEGSAFLLKNNSALGLNNIKKLSVDELLLALAMEDVKSVPKNKTNQKTKSTAVYGAENSGKNEKAVPVNDLGTKKINGAKQLAESGFRESSVLVAKETFRKYPETRKIASDRIFFADILEKLGLYDEAYAEYLKTNSLSMKDSEKAFVKGKIESLSKRVAGQN